MITLWVSCVFLAAGTLDWVWGWVYIVLYASSMSAIGMILKRHNPELIEARMRFLRTDTKPFDKVFMAIYVPLMYGQNVVCGLDAVRYGWAPLPAALAYPGVVLYVAGMALMTWSMVVNRHAESTVRIQTDRGHTVVSTGPYRWVRHPMYVGMLTMHLGTPLVLGSAWGLAITGLIIALLVWRTAREDRALQGELPGYTEYASRTRYRLVPQVW